MNSDITTEKLILSTLLLNNSKRKEIVSSLDELDFISPLSQECFVSLKTAFDNDHPFDGEFKRTMMQTYKSVIDPSIAGNLTTAIIEQRAKSKKHYITSKLEQTLIYAKSPAATPSAIFESCREMVEQAGSLTEIITPLPSVKDNIQSVIAEMDDIRKNGRAGEWIGIDGFEPMLLKEGDLIVLGARPSVGKTAIALECCRNRMNKGLKTAFICLETDEKMLYKRVFSAQSDVEFKKINEGGKNFNHAEMTSFNKAVQEVSNFGGLEIISKYKQTTADLYGICKALKKKGHKIVFIDYLQKIEESRTSKNRFDAVARISSDLKNIALELDLIVVALTQLNRSTEDKRPQMHNLAESARIEQDATAIIMIDRPDKDIPMPPRDYKVNGHSVDMQGLIALHTVKNRNGAKPLKFYYYDFSKYKLLEEYKVGTPKYLSKESR